MFKVTATLFTIMVASTGLAAAKSRPRGLWTMTNGVGGEERFNMSTANIVRGFLIDDETGQADDMYEFKTGGKGLPVKIERDIFKFWSDSMGSIRPLHSIATNDRNGDQRFLLAIIAGDPSFSVMQIDPQLGLELKHRQELNGLLPCSLDYHEELGLIAVITCGEEGTLEMFNFDTKTGKTKSAGDTVQLEVEQTKVEQYDFAFSEDTAPAQVSFTPRGEGLVVLYHGEEDNYKGLVYYHLNDDGTVETGGEKGPATTELANPDTELYPIFNPFGFCTVNSDQVDEGDVLIMLTIAGTWDVSTYKANIKDGKFKKSTPLPRAGFRVGASTPGVNITQPTEVEALCQLELWIQRLGRFSQSWMSILWEPSSTSALLTTRPSTT
ncbi:hypothetical protein SARC_08387 [Sphaeroforma arctica JP610]|uniref:BPP domain-containing protein n=1 Tax=Sphaeroforma arctica JP610 TaxID=667725 RepID=A0A0L0FTC0_9EUKA|nr:hypothetical protein SARC_08387 [Sphaeroforma arctica JP610]KNC79218.1 hypothetical protein SARC_08387 [Sphaeroforma arctica JP610]|eukprot:XP_014153120.1 hypothetical protein SARC_08387 [Sphaeroforma arctica JP610]